MPVRPVVVLAQASTALVASIKEAATSKWFAVIPGFPGSSVIKTVTKLLEFVVVAPFDLSA